MALLLRQGAWCEAKGIFEMHRRTRLNKPQGARGVPFLAGLMERGAFIGCGVRVTCGIEVRTRANEGLEHIEVAFDAGGMQCR